MQDKIAGAALDYGPRAARFFHKIQPNYGPRCGNNRAFPQGML